MFGRKILHFERHKQRQFTQQKKRNFRQVSSPKLPWIPVPSTVNNKLKRREGSGSTERFFD
jgi:hypothetical protein